MKYVIGIDLGTSAVKLLLVNQEGTVCAEVSRPYPLIQTKAGYSEQEPEQWVKATVEGLAELVQIFTGNVEDIEGLSLSGQMHGLVLLDPDDHVLRNAILWNDTRTSAQCHQIVETVGEEFLLRTTKNRALEGFTLPKLLWVKENEPDIFKKTSVFLLPKDYVRYRLTGKIHSDYSDAAGTLLLDVMNREWSEEICRLLEIPVEICPPLVESHTCVGELLPSIVRKTGLSPHIKVFAGGADNACGAIGTGILSTGKTLCSIGTSGVVLSYEAKGNKEFQGKVHYFNHGQADAFYTMGVTLSAGYSLNWFKNTFAKREDFQTLLTGIDQVPMGAKGLLFTPYLTGERTPHPDSVIRGSFIGIDASHQRSDFVRAVMEGITFSLRETIEIFREYGEEVDSVISIGGGAKSPVWLQMQADIFHADIIKLSSEQGPGMGAAMLAAFGCGWFPSLEACAEVFIQPEKTYHPIAEHVEVYNQLFGIYKQVYSQTKALSEDLMKFRK